MLSENNNIKTFSDFVDSVTSAKHEHYTEKKGNIVANEVEFTNMKEYLTKLYQGVEALHSFMDENGSIFDCIPLEQQPSVKESGRGLSKTPDLPAIKGKSGSRDNIISNHVESLLSPNHKDKFGNAMSSPDGSIPLQRITLEMLTRFGTLQHFFQKSPVGSAHPQSEAAARSAQPHRYAHALQNTDNLGGHSILNIWNPSIGADEVDKMSLSQHWYAGGNGPNLQTAEVGWQVLPAMYGSKSAFFIYWTADNYGSTGGYNLTRPGFVQTNNSWTLGGTLPTVSVTNGPQYEIEVAFYLNQGNWWLYVGGTDASHAIGYYPTSIYNNGAMASKASSIDYGGEVASSTTSSPPMGSGRFASEGWQKAAYQRDIYYFSTAGGIIYADLDVSQVSPCYTANVINSSPPWNETLWFGGPGGTNC